MSFLSQPLGHSGLLEPSLMPVFRHAVHWPDAASISNPQDPQYRRPAWAMFAQDTWKLTRKITLDYGVRYDYQPAPRELHDRTSMFAPGVRNPSAGGLLGGTQFAGSGTGRCNCSLTDTYKLAFGPRIGVAYKMGRIGPDRALEAEINRANAALMAHRLYEPPGDNVREWVRPAGFRRQRGLHGCAKGICGEPAVAD